MLITDGAPESYEKVFEEYNWVNNKSVMSVMLYSVWQLSEIWDKLSWELILIKGWIWLIWKMKIMLSAELWATNSKIVSMRR